MRIPLSLVTRFVRMRTNSRQAAKVVLKSEKSGSQLHFKSICSKLSNTSCYILVMGWVVFIMILLNGFYIYLGSESTYHGIKMAFEPKKPRFLLFLLILTDHRLMRRMFWPQTCTEVKLSFVQSIFDVQLDVVVQMVKFLRAKRIKMLKFWRTNFFSFQKTYKD